MFLYGLLYPTPSRNVDIAYRRYGGTLVATDYPVNQDSGRFVATQAPGLVMFNDVQSRDLFAEDLAAQFPGIPFQHINTVAISKGRHGDVHVSVVTEKGVLPK